MLCVASWLYCTGAIVLGKDADDAVYVVSALQLHAYMLVKATAQRSLPPPLQFRKVRRSQVERFASMSPVSKGFSWDWLSVLSQVTFEYSTKDEG